METDWVEKILEKYFPTDSVEFGKLSFVRDSVTIEEDAVYGTFALQKGTDDTKWDEQIVRIGGLEHLADRDRFRAFLAFVGECLEENPHEEILRARPADFFNLEALETGGADGSRPDDGESQTGSDERLETLEAGTACFGIGTGARSMVFTSQGPWLLLSGRRSPREGIHGLLRIRGTSCAFERTVRTPGRALDFVAETPSGQLVATSSRGVEVWNYAIGRQSIRARRPDIEFSNEAILGDDSYGGGVAGFHIREAFLRGSRLITNEVRRVGCRAESTRIRVFDLESGEHRTVVGGEERRSDRGQPVAVTVTPDGTRWVAAGTADGDGWIESRELVADGSCERVRIERSVVVADDLVGDLTISPDGRCVVLIGSGVRVLNLVDGTVRHRFDPVGDAFCVGAFVDDHRFVAARGARLEQLEIFDFAAGDHLGGVKLECERGDAPRPGRLHCEVSERYASLALAAGSRIRLVSLSDL